MLYCFIVLLLKGTSKFMVDIRTLINKSNRCVIDILQKTAEIAVQRSHYEISVEHFFYAALQNSNSDFARILQNIAENDPEFIPKILQNLNKALENFRNGNTARPVFSPLFVDLLEASWNETSLTKNFGQIRSGTIFLAFLKRPNAYLQNDFAEIFAINKSNQNLFKYDNISDNFAKLTLLSAENQAENAEQNSNENSQTQNFHEISHKNSGDSFIQKFCENFTQKAKDGKLDAVFGRDAEIRKMIDILARRRKNNPILVGDPGVGKTAVLEGLALRIVEGDVPELLQNVELLSLDLGLLEAGASVKGEFERRLKGVLDEIKNSEQNIILFIDEAHLLVGAGNSAGVSDAANLMKPALARGEIKTCAATTWKEYKKYFEKDPALTRRFQLVKLDEPSVETTTLILRGVRNSYEKSHGVLIRDDALQAAAELSNRYIQGRFLPDKAIDLLDTACARIKVNLSAKPAELENCQRSIQAKQRQLNGILRDKDNGNAVNEEQISELNSQIDEFQKSAESIQQTWEQELQAANDFIEKRNNFIAVKNSETPETPENLAELQKVLDESRGKFLNLQKFIQVEVSPDSIAQIVSDWTGIPVGKMARQQAKNFNELENILNQRVKGQTAALKIISEGIAESKAGLKAPEQPLGVFLLVGPSGTGKTETALALAENLFGDEKSLISINMSEFQEKHNVSRLIGSPPGYVGYGEGGMLSEAVRKKPYSVVLLDECEKAHLDVMQVFYQVFDKGILTDGEGVEIKFSNTLILLTSNLASDVIQKITADSENTENFDYQELLTMIRPILSKHFQPALLARMQIVPYVSLLPEALKNIAVLKLNKIKNRLFNQHKMTLRWDENLLNEIVARCKETETGARNIDTVLNVQILPKLARFILEKLSAEDNQENTNANTNLFVDLSFDNQQNIFTMNFCQE